MTTSWPGASSLLNYGGALNNASPVIDPTTDLDAGAGNQAFADLAAMTNTRIKAWVQLIPNGTGTPTIGSHYALWGNALAVAPLPLRDGGGEYRVVWPVNVANQIPVGSPGYSGPQPLLLLAGWAQSESLTVPYNVQVVASSANVATIRIWNLAGSLVDAVGIIDIWMI